MSERGRLKEIAERTIKLMELCVKGLTGSRMSKADYVMIRRFTSYINKLAEDLPK